MPLTFPSTIYAYIDTYELIRPLKESDNRRVSEQARRELEHDLRNLDPHVVITTDPPPHSSRCAQYVLNNTGIAKITVELEDK